MLTGDSKINKSLIKFVKDRPGHDKRYAIWPEKINKELGWKARIPFEAGLKTTIEWYLKNDVWLNSIISGEYLEFYNKHYSS